MIDRVDYHIHYLTSDSLGFLSFSHHHRVMGQRSGHIIALLGSVGQRESQIDKERDTERNTETQRDTEKDIERQT